MRSLVQLNGATWIFEVLIWRYVLCKSTPILCAYIIPDGTGEELLVTSLVQGANLLGAHFDGSTVDERTNFQGDPRVCYDFER